MKVLFVSQEMNPYTTLSEISNVFQRIPHITQDSGNEIRVLMPRFGTINERRHKLHEVVRLSGMNIIVDDEDYPLIIKVASYPGARLQIYFLDNEEFFKRKMVFTDEDENLFEDNMERMVFFNKGAMETVRKFGWPPDIIHCHGSFTSLIPLYAKKVYNDDPIFEHSKILFSGYQDMIGEGFTDKFKTLAAINGLEEADIEDYIKDGKVDLNAGAITHADGVVVGEEAVADRVKELAGDKPLLDYNAPDDHLKVLVDFFDQFYEEDEDETES